MRRAFVLMLAAIATLVAAAPTAAATKPRHSLYIEAHSGGFLIQLQSRLGSGRVRLLLDRGGEVAYYNARAQIGEDSVRARFGRLGSLDFSFAPGRGEGSVGCSTEEEGWQRGTFKGALVFHGEHHYANVDVRHASGWLQTYPADCAGGAGRAESKAVARASAATAETGVFLEALSSDRLPLRTVYCTIENDADGVKAGFSALREEKREGMLIFRGGQVRGGAARFQWDLGTGTALVEPPAPFSGRASYRREGHGKASWRGDLSVPVLGASRPMRLTGAAFTAHLGPAH